jgi:hypothetical protein
VAYPDARHLLTKKLGRRITHALHARAHNQMVYLEDGAVLEAPQELANTTHAAKLPE